jgi:hypothetical protein
MSVFDSDPPDGIRDRRLPWWVVPPEEVGCYVETRRVLARTAESAVVLTDTVAYRPGFMLGADVLRRSGDAIDALGTTFDVQVGLIDVEKLLTVTVEFSDGRTASNADFVRLEDVGRELSDPTADELRLHEGGGGGNGVQRRVEWWVTPLPTPGPLAITLTWSALGNESFRTELDAQPIIEAGLRSQPIWPDGD